MASLDVTAVPSDSESLSNAILESMAAGVPVVATNVGGNPELVSDDRGILVPVRDVDAFAVAIAQLLSNAEHRDRLGQNAKQFAVEHFSAESITREYERLYEELSYSRAANPASLRPRKSVSKQLKVAIVGPSLKYVGGQSVQLDLLLRYWSGILRRERSLHSC